MDQEEDHGGAHREKDEGVDQTCDLSERERGMDGREGRVRWWMFSIPPPSSQARILSIIAGDDESAAKHNVTRFYGAVLYPPMAEYRVVLGKPRPLQDHIH